MVAVVVALCTGAPVRAAPVGAEGTGPRVTTVAGDGTAGLRDGAALQAQFLGPAAIAIAANGALYIADESAQRIRKLENGRVSTVAGSGQPVASGLAVLGGYRDGPAIQAQFNEPTGIAVGPDGVIYVADMLNRCIRRIKDGMVDTYAGSPARDGQADGVAATASFHRPHGLAIDADGNLYVADLFGPVRTISPAGIVSTLTLAPGVGVQEFRTVAVSGKGDGRSVFVTDGTFMHVYRNGKDSWTGAREEGDQPLPFAYAIAALDDLSLVVADARDHVIRLYRHIDPPYVTSAFANAVAGRAQEDWAAAGFRDGPVSEAKFSSPRGVAVSNGTIYVADAGNRRIRALPLPDYRRPVGNRISEFAHDPKHYRIIYINGSHAFYLTDFADSVGGILERRLNARLGALALPRPARVSVVRADGSSIVAFDEIIRTYLSDGQADLIVLGMSAGGLTTPTISAAFSQWLKELQRTLHQAGTSLFVMEVPSAQSLAPVEMLLAREEFVSVPAGLAGLPHWPADEPGPYDIVAWTEKERIEEEAIKASGVPFYAAFHDFAAFERRSEHVPLFGSNDSHISPTAARMLGEFLARRLEALRPWNAAKPH